MESTTIYEDAYDELCQIQKTIASDSVTIHFNKLDENTKREMTTAIQNVISKRKGEIDAVRLGVQ